MLTGKRLRWLGWGVLPFVVGCAAPAGVMVDPDTSDETLARFADPDSDFVTTDVRDVDGDIVQFDAEAGTLIWVADGLAFTGYDVDGNLLRNGFFQVRFGSENGVQAAYFTETAPATVCDIQVNGGNLSIFATAELVPQK